MSRLRLFVLAVLLSGFSAVRADTIQLKDKAAVTGKILSEKQDSVAVDVGYTVLVIPRNSIAAISKADEAKPPAKTAPASKSARVTEAAPAVEAKSDFYHATARPSPSATCATS